MELTGKDPEEGLTVQGKHDGEVGAQRAPHKHMVDDCPEACVKSNLHTETHAETTAQVHSKYTRMGHTVVKYRGCQL